MALRQLLWLAPQAELFQPRRRSLPGWQLQRLNLDRNPANETLDLTPPRVGVMDLSLIDLCQLHFLHDWIEQLHPTEWIALLREPPAVGSAAASLVAQYCACYLTLPYDEDSLRQSLTQLEDMATIKHQVAARARVNGGIDMLDGISSAINLARSQLAHYARTREPVLILGASGTGKEQAAQFIHDNSVVRRGPFVVVHCAALPETLTQSELFGHEKGAFTSAVSRRIGRIEAAQQGTLLLDGIDELLPQQQSSLLRFLQEGVIERLGSQQVQRVDARVISTSSSAPETLIEQGRLRPDLYYRLSVLQVTLPLLRERMEDLILLARQILTLTMKDRPGRPKTLSKEAMAAIMTYSWPGNVRELQNCLNRAALLSSATVIQPGDLGLARPPGEPAEVSRFSLQQFRAEAEQRAACHALAVSNHNLSAAARLLNISRLSLYRLIAKYGLERNAAPNFAPNTPAPMQEGSNRGRTAKPLTRMPHKSNNLHTG